MASKIKVDQIEGSTASTITLPSGQTLDLSSGSITLPDSAVDLSTAKVTGTIPVSKGGTGLTSLGSANQVLRTNSGGTALEFADAEGGGKVLQVVQTVLTTDTSTTSTSFVAISNYEVDITPSATSSKILIMANFSTEVDTGGVIGYYTLYKNDTTNLGHSSYGFGLQSAIGGVNRGFGTICYLDTPNTTSSINYQVYQKVDSGSVKVGGGGSTCTITAMEIGA